MTFPNEHHLDSALGMLDEACALIRKVAPDFPKWAGKIAEDFDTAIARLTFDFIDEEEVRHIAEEEEGRL